MLKIQLKPQQLIYNQGQRKNNEDYYYPKQDAPPERAPFFLVCDGMGGAEKGEVASRMAAEGFARFFEENPTAVPAPEYLSRALATVEEEFDKYLEENPTAKGMGTTLTLLWFHQEGITLGHIGDSRIYRFRKGEAKALTEDHSFVGELLAANLITEEEAERHPKKNVITRAIQGAYTGGTKMTVQNLKQVEAGDIYMLCSDGITEACPTPVLQEMYESNPRLEDLHQAIEARCAERSQDNFTALLIEVEAVENVNPVPKREEATKAVQPLPVTQPSVAEAAVPKKSSGQWRVWIGALLIVAAAIWGINQMGNPGAEPTAQAEEPTEEEAPPPTPKPTPPRKPATTAGTNEETETAQEPDSILPLKPEPADTSPLDAPPLPIPALSPYQDDQSNLFGYKSDTVVVIKAQFSEASTFSEGMAKVKDAEKDKYGFIDRSGKYVIDPVFTEATDFKNGVATVQESIDQEEYQIDQDGRKLAQEQKNQQQ